MLASSGRLRAPNGTLTQNERVSGRAKWPSCRTRVALTWTMPKTRPGGFGPVWSVLVWPALV
eukprot:1104357-Lingulodinium_polyedra.AAC.1